MTKVIKYSLRNTEYSIVIGSSNKLTLSFDKQYKISRKRPAVQLKLFMRQIQSNRQLKNQNKSIKNLPGLSSGVLISSKINIKKTNATVIPYTFVAEDLTKKNINNSRRILKSHILTQLVKNNLDIEVDIDAKQKDEINKFIALALDTHRLSSKHNCSNTFCPRS